MDWKLEVVPIPVTDVERSRRFYSEQAGFVVDLDIELGGGMRLVQLTPPGSACSIQLNAGLTGPVPGSVRGLQLVVPDVEAARTALVERGVEASPVRHMDGGEWHEGPGGDWNSFVFFSDPDGNGWILQESPTRD